MQCLGNGTQNSFFLYIPETQSEGNLSNIFRMLDSQGAQMYNFSPVCHVSAQTFGFWSIFGLGMFNLFQELNY